MKNDQDTKINKESKTKAVKIKKQITEDGTNHETYTFPTFTGQTIVILLKSSS